MQFFFANYGKIVCLRPPPLPGRRPLLWGILDPHLMSVTFGLFNAVCEQYHRNAFNPFLNGEKKSFEKH